MGNDVAINMGGASGNFELNVFRPMVIHNFHAICQQAHRLQEIVDHHFLGLPLGFFLGLLLGLFVIGGGRRGALAAAQAPRATGDTP